MKAMAIAPRSLEVLLHFLLLALKPARKIVNEKPLIRHRSWATYRIKGDAVRR